MAGQPPLSSETAVGSSEDVEASIICGGVALAAARRVLQSYRMEVWWAFLCQAAVGISTMVMSVILLCFMVDRVSEGNENFSEPVGQWATAFALNTLHLIFQPLLLGLFLLVPCRSRPRLYSTVWALCSLSLQLDINAFIQIMIWRVNKYATCDFLNIGADDMSCTDVQGTGTATLIMIVLFQGAMDWWYVRLLHRARPMSADPVLREALTDQSKGIQERVGVVRWFLKEGKAKSSCCKFSKKPETFKAAYNHKRTDIELSGRGAGPNHERDLGQGALPPYQPHGCVTITTKDIEGHKL